MPHAFQQQLAVGFALGDNLVDLSPVRQAAYAAVVYEVIGFQLAAVVVVFLFLLLGIIAVDCIELHAALTTPVYGVLQEFTFSHTPQDDTMTVAYQHAERFRGERKFFAYVGILVGDDGAVEVHCYYCHGLFLYGVIVRVAIVAVAVIAVRTIVAIVAIVPIMSVVPVLAVFAILAIAVTEAVLVE